MSASHLVRSVPAASFAFFSPILGTHRKTSSRRIIPGVGNIFSGVLRSVDGTASKSRGGLAITAPYPARLSSVKARDVLIFPLLAFSSAFSIALTEAWVLISVSTINTCFPASACLRTNEVICSKYFSSSPRVGGLANLALGEISHIIGFLPNPKSCQSALAKMKAGAADLAVKNIASGFRAATFLRKLGKERINCSLFSPIKTRPGVGPATSSYRIAL